MGLATGGDQATDLEETDGNQAVSGKKKCKKKNKKKNK